MTWKKNINYVSNKLRTVSFLIYKASSTLDDKSPKIIYNISLFSHTLTIVVKHGETHYYTTNIQCLYLLQKSHTNITHSEYFASTNKLFVKLNILKLGIMLYI